MSNWLMDLFSKGAHSEEDISSDHFTYRVMKELQELRTPLMITFKQSAEHEMEQCVTMVMNVDLKKKQIRLDEFSTQKAHFLAVAGEGFRIETSESGISVVFHATALNFGKRDGIYFYQIEFPDHLEYQQRREAFRVKLAASANIQVHFKNQEGIALRSKLVDLSHTGMGLHAAGNLEHRIKPLDIIERCTFSPTEDTSITCKFEVRRVYYDVVKQITNIGCLFLQLPQSEQRTVNKIVSLLQREARKRENRLD